MSQNDEYFNRRVVTKRNCYCTLMFHFENVSKGSTALAVQKHRTENHLNVMNLKNQNNFVFTGGYKEMSSFSAEQ